MAKPKSGVSARSPRRRAKAPPFSPAELRAALREAAEHRVSRHDDEAIALYSAIEMRNPEAVDARYFLALIDLAQSRPAEAIPRLEALAARLPNSADVWEALDFAYREAGRWDEQLTALDQLRALRPDRAQPERPIVLQVLGRVDEAVEEYRANAGDPKTRAWAAPGLAQLRPGDLTETDRLTLREVAQTGSVSERIDALFALGVLEEHRGDIDAAFSAFADANRLKRQTLTGEIPLAARPAIGPQIVARHPDDAAANHAAAIAFRKAVFTPEFFAAHAGRGSHLAAPIFVVGMPRSGSTLIEQILASHRRVQGLGEAPAFMRAAQAAYPYDLFAAAPPGSFRTVAEAYFKGMHGLGWTSAPRFVDKMLSNYMDVGMIHVALPRATILHAVRDPADTCVACFRQNFQTGHEYSYDLSDLGLEYVRYREMMHHWASVLPGRVIEVSHEALVADPETQIRWLVTEACGLDWDEACLRFHEARRAVRTASVTQVRQPIFTTSLQRWRRYENALPPLFEALGAYAPAG